MTRNIRMMMVLAAVAILLAACGQDRSAAPAIVIPAGQTGPAGGEPVASPSVLGQTFARPPSGSRTASSVPPTVKTSAAGAHTGTSQQVAPPAPASTGAASPAPTGNAPGNAPGNATAGPGAAVPALPGPSPTAAAATASTPNGGAPTTGPPPAAGTEIAYAGALGSPGSVIPGGNDGIHLMKADGTGQIRLTTAPFLDRAPAMSPDGTKVAFRRVVLPSGESDIYVVDTAGSHLTQLTANGQDDTPTWSADGRQITFVRGYGPTSMAWSMNADGTAQAPLTGLPPGSRQFSYAPDGRHLAYVMGAFSNTPEIWVANLDGSNAVPLTTTSEGANQFPAWSPDGSRIAFSSARSDSGDIYLMNADGSGQQRLTSLGASNSAPSWSPDGARIVFQHSPPGPSDYLFVMHADGSGLTQLTTAGHEITPSW